MKAGFVSGAAANTNCNGSPPNLGESAVQAHRTGAAPARVIAEKIQDSLSKLSPDASLFVDTLGNIHLGKDLFLKGNATPLVSFKRDAISGDVIVYSGLPPTNQTFCRSCPLDPTSAQELPTFAQPLRYFTVLKTGDVLSLTPSCSITIPGSEMSEPRTPEEKLAQLIAKAQPGQFVQLGRLAVAELPQFVSRAHCRVEVIENNSTLEGGGKIVIKVFPGIPGSTPIFVARGDEAPEEVLGEKQVAPGTKVILGESVGTVTLPFFPGSIDELSLRVSQSIIGGVLGYAERALQSYRAPKQGDYSEDVRARERIDSAVAEENLIKIKVLQNHIVEGLKLVKEGKSDEAISLFRNTEALELLGYRFEENNLFTLGGLTHEAIVENVRMVASRSWFQIDQKLVYPSIGCLREGLTPQNDQEANLLACWEKEIALIWAEEYTHALQDALGGLVSRKAALLPCSVGKAGHEADVALFFHEHGVRLIYDFVKNRYSEREEALQLAGGFQTPETQGLFRRALNQLPIGGKLYVGRSGIPPAEQSPESAAFSLPCPDQVVPKSPWLLNGKKAHSLLADVECVVTKNSDGSYDVEPFASPASFVFVPDSAGYYHRIDSTKIVEPGTPVYVGRAFRLEL